jgi:hypothetical protein
MTDFTTSPDALQPKWWLNSLTIRGALLSAASAALPALGAAIGFDLNGETIRQLGQHTTAIIQAAGGIAGLALSIKGRARAAAPITRQAVRVMI